MPINLGTLSKWMQLLVVCSVSILVNLVVYFILRIDIKLEPVKNIVPEVSMNIKKKVNELLPNDLGVNRFVANVSNIAVLNKVELNSFKLYTQKYESGYVVVPISVDVIGNTKDLLMFEQGLLQIDRLLTINKLVIKGKSLKLNFQIYSANETMDLKEYRMQDLSVIDSYKRSGNIIIENAVNPFVNNFITDENISLVKKLTLIGTVKQSKRFIAFVQDVGTRVVAVKVGDMVGSQGFEVVEISESRLVLFNKENNKWLECTL